MPRSQKQPIAIKPQPIAIKPQETIIVKPQEAAKPSLLSTVKEGFSFGAGSAIAHRLVGSLFSSAESNVTSDREYRQCLAEHHDFVDSAVICAHLLRK